MSKYLTKSVAATISALLLLGCAAPAFAADAAVEKKETSYLILNADGSVQEQITSDWLHSDDGFDSVTDESDLSDIQNLKSDVMPEQSGNTLKWTTDETDIYYQGKNSAQAPVGVSIEYTLDGKAVTADELKGQSGHLVATVKLTNNTGEEVTVNGKKRTVYTPFFTVAAAVLPSENFKNITTEHGLVESDSKTQVACYLAMPGMKEAVSDLLPDSFDKLDDLMLDTLTLEADVTDCTVPTFLFAAAPSLSDLDLDEVSDELGDTMDELTDAIDQLKDGSGALDDAVGTLVESLDTFASSYSQFDAGVDSALNGTQTLANGTGNLLENAQLLATKTGELSLGAIQLQNSTAQLAGVMNQQLVPGLVEASEKKTALEDKMTELSGKLETVEIPDMTALKAQLGAGAEQVFDGAASGAAKAASEAAASNAATVASQKTAEAIKGNVQAASSSEDVTNAAAALTTQLYQDGYSAGYQASKTCVEMALNELGLDDAQKEVILNALAAQPSTSTPSAEVISNGTAQVSGMVEKIASDIDPNAIASAVGPKVAEQVAPIVTEEVTSSDDLAAAKQSAVQQVAAAIPDINTDELKSLMGEFKDLSSQAGEMMDSVDTLTGALYNAENPADTDTVVGAANAISDGAAKLGSGASQLATGTSAFATGVGTLDAGTNQLLSGMETLSSSSKTVSNAIGQFQTGGAELKDGTSELSDGMTEFSDTINDKLDGLSEITDPDSTLARVIDIMKDRADSFKGSGRADGTDMTVSYVMRTATDSSSNSTSTTEETTTETETKDSFWNRVANLFSK
jgi:X-X-X-Leu-X-X-Gly heptad repeat protein